MFAKINKIVLALQFTGMVINSVHADPKCEGTRNKPQPVCKYY